MSIARRLAQLFRGKADDAVGKAHDPREALNDSYARQLETLAKVRRGLADVITSRKRLDMQLAQLRQYADRLRADATRAVEAGDDNQAREILAQRGAITGQIDDVTAQRDLLLAEEAKLTTTATRLQTRVETFRTRKDTISATYTAAAAQNQIGDALSGISEEMGDAHLTLQHAEDATAQLQARAGALDELVIAGVLDEAGTAGPGGVQASLDAIARDVNVETELAAIKAERAHTELTQAERPAIETAIETAAIEGTQAEPAQQAIADGHPRGTTTASPPESEAER